MGGAPPTITDDRGNVRPLWTFPKTRYGVPDGCPLTAEQQRKLEHALDVPWQNRTPTAGPYSAVAASLVTVYFALPFVASLTASSRARTYVAVAGLVAVCVLARDKALRARFVCAIISALALSHILYPSPSSNAVGVSATIGVSCVFGVMTLLPDWLYARLNGGSLGPTIVPPTKLRALFLQRGRCPSCAHVLYRPDETASARLECRHCESAWRPSHRGIDPLHSGPKTGQAAQTCPKCKYSLAGLAPNDQGNIRCPECGGHAPLTVQIPGHLMPTRCWGCDRSLRGLPLFNGDRVRCPDCGLWRSGVSEEDLRLPPEASV